MYVEKKIKSYHVSFNTLTLSIKEVFIEEKWSFDYCGESGYLHNLYGILEEMALEIDFIEGEKTFRIFCKDFGHDIFRHDVVEALSFMTKGETKFYIRWFI